MSDIEFPKKLRFLFEPHRYKVAHGGRGSAKSWGFARALLIQGAQKPLRVGCFREVQKSIKESVHQLLSDQIQQLGLGGFYEVLETEIKGRNGTRFVFAGLAHHTVESIKSYEGLDRAWVEEAQTVKKKSWDILIPTIRGDESEIWVSFNPELDTDDTWVRFVVNTPPNAVVVAMNYSDNPWFPAVLEQERLHCQLTNKEDYDTIWEGKCRKAVAGAIYAGEITSAIEQGRVRTVPYDPMLKVHYIFDLGWNDATTVIMAQRQASELRLIGYIEDSHKTLEHYSQEIKGRHYNDGSVWLPHDGEHKDYKTGKSAKEMMEAFGHSVEIIPNVSIEDGIRTARSIFHRVYFDNSAERLIVCLQRYRRSINQATQEPGSPLHDEYSHGADAFRYLALVADQLSNAGRGNLSPAVLAAAMSSGRRPATRSGY